MESNATVQIQTVDSSGFKPAKIKLFIDQQCVHVLMGRSPQVFSVAPGVRKVRIKWLWYRSEPLELSLSAGERVVLECRYGVPEGHRFYITAGMIAGILGSLPRLLVGEWPLRVRLVLCGVGLVALALAFDVDMTPGSCLFLRRESDQPIVVAATRRVFPRPPPMTLRRWMILIAAAAAMLGLETAVQNSFARYQSAMRSVSSRYAAESYAQQEQLWKQLEQLLAHEEADDIAAVNAHSKMVMRSPEDVSLAARLGATKRSLAENRAGRAHAAAHVAYSVWMKDKHLRAATHPWEPVPPDPPPPP